MTLSTAAPKSQNRIFWLILAGLILLTFALRIHQLDAVNLRGDEAYNAVHWTKTPFSSVWMDMIQYEPNPGALVTYWGWSRFTGVSEFALRYLPVLANILGLAIMLALAHRILRDWRLALLVGVLWVGAPFLIWHAQDARQYALLTALTPLNFYLLLRIRDDDSPSAPALYLLFQTLTVYIYYVEVFWIAAQLVYLLTLRDRRLLMRMSRLWMLIGVFIIPLVVQIGVVIFVGEYQATAASTQVSALFTTFAPTLLFGDNTLPLIIGILLTLLLVGGVVMSRWREKWLIVAWMVVPIVLITLISIRANFFLPRYVVTVTPALLLAIVMIVASASRKRLRLAGGVVLLMSAIFSVEVRDYFYTDAPKAPDWVGLMDYLAGHSTADDTILFGQPDPAIEYYYRSPADLYIIPLEWEVDVADRESELDRLLREEEAIVLVNSERTWETAQYLQAHAQLIPGDTYPNVVQYRAWNVKSDEIAHPLALNFGDVATLRGYVLEDRSTLILYWEANAQTAGEYSVLVHIEAAPDAPPVAVLDHAIAGAVISTRTWSPETLYRDPIALPIDLPTGELTIRVGLKDANGDPIPLDDAPDGRYPLVTFTIDD
ncbi:MAG: glycosyltransferase family 39 protein [Aggregatilineales bacterium]